MRPSILVAGLILCVLTNQDALAQDFWYVPPGYDYGYYYGIDLGNGVGYGQGYGAGIGLLLPLGALTGSKTADVLQVQGLCCDEVAAPPTSIVDPEIDKLFPVKSKATAGLKSKKSETKVQQPKPVTKTKNSKTPTHMAAKTGQDT